MKIGGNITIEKDPIVDWAISARKTISNAEKSHPKRAKTGYPVIGNEPAFTSIAFPYAGFYLMRDSWDFEGTSLFFSGSYTSSRHGNCDAAGIQLAAYGRSLLVYGGLPTYGMSESIDWPRELHRYLEEDSSYKTNTVLVDGKVQARKERAESPLQIPWYTSEDFDFVERRYEDGYRLQEQRGAEAEIDTAVTHTRSVFFVRSAVVYIVVDRLDNTSADDHTYSQVWNFLPKVAEEDGRGIVHGFKRGEVLTDEAGRRIYTAQAGSPNVTLHHFFASADLCYSTYFAEEEQYAVPFSGDRRQVFLGWFARKIEDRLGAADVHAAWAEAAGETSILVTVIAPAPTEQSRVIEVIDTSEAGFPGCVLNLEDGQRIGFALAAQSVAQLDVLGVRASGRALLVYQAADSE